MVNSKGSENINIFNIKISKSQLIEKQLSEIQFKK